MWARVERTRGVVEAWCDERSGSASGWLPRGLVLLWLAYVAVRHVNDPLYDSLLGSLNLGIHELGHVLFGWSPWVFLVAAGGTLAQFAAPVASAVMFARQPDYFAVGFCCGWLATNLYDAAAYAGDAQAMELPLVSVGDGPAYHDWEYMLTSLGLIAYDGQVAALLRLAGFLAMWSAVAACGWMVWRMARGRRR